MKVYAPERLGIIFFSVFIMAYVAIRQLQTFYTKTNDVIYVLFASKLYIFNEHWESSDMQFTYHIPVAL